MTSSFVGMDDAAVDDLVTRVDAMLPPRACRVIEFVASGRSEGTSTVASSFAAAHATQWQRKVLLLSVPRRSASPQAPGEGPADGEAPSALTLTRRADGVHTARLGSDGRRYPTWSQLHRSELWRTLRDRFDLVVLDMPSTDVSRAALKVAAEADGVVVVVAAERSRAPVVRDLVERLHALRANVLGTVLNKRRYHLPAVLYRWL